jgi:hypothetical protein
MVRTVALTLALTGALSTFALAQQFPPQPAAPPSPLGQGNEQERVACHPDVVKFCQTQLDANPQDVLGILSCLQGNRAKISAACQRVLASHGQ